MIDDIDISNDFLRCLIKVNKKSISNEVVNRSKCKGLSYRDDVEEKISESILIIELCELVLRLRKFIEDKEINDLYVNEALKEIRLEASHEEKSNDDSEQLYSD